MARSRRVGSAWANARRAENEYRRHLRRIASNIDHIVRSMVPDDSQAVRRIEEILEEYARILEPWARAVAARMIEDVARRDANAFLAYAREMGLELRREIETAPTGLVVQRLMDEQVHLITSLPRDAARRVHDEAVEGLSQGTRWEEIARSILETGEVTRSRANTIARTETGRTASALTQARAQSIGSPGYIWRSARDLDVRPRHRELDGKFILWSQPPIATDEGQPPIRAHAGAIFNCRCFSEPVLAGEVPQEGPLARSPEYQAALRNAAFE